jgi:cell filamentation protein
VQINAQQAAQLQRAVRSLEHPALPPGHSPGQERLADLFLKNTPEKNNADPRLASAQAIVDAALKTARDRCDSARMVSSVGESTRQLIADRIKTGGTLDAEIGRAPGATAVPPPPQKDRSR